MLSLAAREPSAVGLVRREADRIGRLAGLGAEALGRLALVCNEATDNLLRHGGGGEVLLGTRAVGAGLAVELVTLDRGPGMADVGAALVDGHSPGGTAGYGLGSLRRQSDAFDVHSVPGLGTAVLTRVGTRDRHGAAPSKARPHALAPLLDVGAVRVARRDERRCGDAWRARGDASRCSLCLVDGLGHGDGAADAALLALEAFDAAGDAPAAAQLARMHEALRGTRGAVGGVVAAQALGGEPGVRLEHAGTGNVTAALCTPGARPRRLYSVEGMLGLGTPAVRTVRATLEPRALLVLHSDGIRTPDVLERRGGLARRDPTLIAAVLYRDGGDRNDDCAVLVARVRAA